MAQGSVSLREHESSRTAAGAYLLWCCEGRPEHGHALGDHLDLELVLLLEPVHKLLQRRVVGDVKVVPQSPLDLAVLGLGREDGSA